MADHPHGQSEDADMFGQATWDARYGGPDRVWSGNPNPRLVEQVADLPAGDALDVGAGEGADVVWLARRGWRVTALDVSPVGLGLVAEHAAESGVADLVTTVHHDLLDEAPLPGGFDLVSAQFVHPPLDRFDAVFRAIGAAVRPGGTLLVVGHHPDDHTTGLRSGHGHGALLFTPEKVVAALDPDEWEVVLAEAQTRPSHRPDGPATATDSVVRAVRR
ncbi:class I SAM-dependent methyltransferase [Marmoricola sp. RAF53]|uniref:class I SAM-dependent methyltransferase n=1 Tax=Marmoricola sp. RAF53 TaxID=3233059 RepID=UPI003F9A02FA